jgi:hypothetical protein
MRVAALVVLVPYVLQEESVSNKIFTFKLRTNLERCIGEISIK